MGDFAGKDNLEERLRAHVEYLAGTLGERNPFWYANLEKARRYIERMFVDAGYDIQHDAYEVADRTFRNVIAEVPGTNRADELLLLGAHYDTAAGTPGADDNASGVATLLELARLLREVSLQVTLRWVAFTLEEPHWFQTPHMGSWVHARECRARGERIAGMISLEMVGYFRDEPRSQGYPLALMRWFYPNRGNFVAVAGNFASRRFVRRLARALASSFPVESTALPFVPGVGLSDNWSFWQEGYPALMVTDTGFFRNPHYHQPSDLPETLDYARMGELVSGLALAIRVLAAA